MRRWAWTMVVLVSACAVAFFAGWVQLRVEPGRYAVLVSKTGGVDGSVVAPGSFRWSPALLLPTNVRLVELSPMTVERRVDLTGQLPSADAYRAFMAGEPDFSWSLSVRITAGPRPEALPRIVERWGVRDDDGLSAWLASQMDAAAASLDAAVAAPDGKPAPGRTLASALSADWPELDIRAVTVLSSRFPDPGLYEEARSLYASYMDSYRAAVEPALASASAKAAQDQVRIDALERYGELLSRYPNLVDYLAIESGLPPRPVQAREP